MNRAIVIGASGFLGRHVVGHLLEKNVEVFATEHKRNIQVAVSGIIPGGIKGLNRVALNRIKADVIFHCARPVMPSFRKWGRIMAARKAEKFNSWLLNELKHASLRPKLVFSSGSLMYGSANHPHDENALLAPISYARQYYRGEMPLLIAQQKNEYPIIMMRLPWLIGMDSWFKWFYLDPILSRQLIPAFDPTDNMMEIITVSDAASIMAMYAEKAEAGIYNVPSANPHTQQEFLEILVSKFDAPIADHRIICGNRLENETMEAFRSNILLTTKHTDTLQNFEYMTLDSALEKIRNKIYTK